MFPDPDLSLTPTPALLQSQSREQIAFPSMHPGNVSCQVTNSRHPFFWHYTTQISQL